MKKGFEELKNQYFGDINDYRKYGILRGLVGKELNSLICWMLTSNDSRSDGKFIDYLTEPLKWKVFDTELYEILRELLLHKNQRDVRAVEEYSLIPRAQFIYTLIKDDLRSREVWKKELLLKYKSKDIIFFDPDNGIEVKSVQKGNQGSSKYILG